LMRKLEMTSFREYRRYLEESHDGNALSEMVDCLTTNHTGFFREEQHFDFLISAILPMVECREEIRIWSAACSTGEEAYSLAFALLEYFDRRGRAVPKIRILATDISNRALVVARRAVYSSERLAHVARTILQKYMLRGLGESQGLFCVKPWVRELVVFQRLNLMESFEEVDEFPLILCRNAMIYFDEETQERLIARFHRRLESLKRIKQPMRYIQPAIYRRAGELLSQTAGG
jgi:chemotaxis protein methyltransferase CheR